MRTRTGRALYSAYGRLTHEWSALLAILTIGTGIHARCSSWAIPVSGSRRFPVLSSGTATSTAFSEPITVFMRRAIPSQGILRRGRIMRRSSMSPMTMSGTMRDSARTVRMLSRQSPSTSMRSIWVHGAVIPTGISSHTANWR